MLNEVEVFPMNMIGVREFCNWHSDRLLMAIGFGFRPAGNNSCTH